MCQAVARHAGTPAEQARACSRGSTKDAAWCVYSDPSIELCLLFLSWPIRHTNCIITFVIDSTLFFCHTKQILLYSCYSCSAVFISMGKWLYVPLNAFWLQMYSPRHYTARTSHGRLQFETLTSEMGFPTISVHGPGNSHRKYGIPWLPQATIHMAYTLTIRWATLTLYTSWYYFKCHFFIW